jgi:cytochrome c-type biogenesis protein CcmH
MVVVSNFIFLLLALALVLGVVAVLARSMRRGMKQDQPAFDERVDSALEGGALGQPLAQDARQTLLAQAQIFRAQLQELENERDAGQLSEDDFARAHDELARRLLEDTQGLGVKPASGVTTQSDNPLPQASTALERPLWFKRSLGFWWSVGLSSFLVLSSITLYANLGQPGALNAAAPGTDGEAMEQGHGASAEDLSAMVNDLTARLKKEPNSADDWLMLARVERTREHFDAANEAFKRSLALSQNADVLIERAEVVALKQKGDFAGEPQQIIDAVLKADPDQANALLLAGSAAFSQGQFKLALERWTRVRRSMDDQAAQAQSLDQVIAMAAQRAGVPAPISRRPATPAVAPLASGSGSGGSISGRVSLSKEILSQVSPTDTVFIYATQSEGPRMPVAIIKTQVSALPLSFELNDASAMSPERRISLFPSLSVHARVSKSGQAMAQPSDLGVTVSPVKLGAKGVELKIQGPYRP